MPKKTTLTAKQLALKYGYRSGLEDSIAEELSQAGVKFSYESEKISFIQPTKKRTYTPDFPITNSSGYSWYLEVKGRFVTADRQKHLYVKEQYANLDIRFVFTNANAKISKTSKTTYGMWCDKYGFKYATKHVPKEWFDE